MSPDAARINESSEQAVRLLKALAHPARLLICAQLRDQEMSVGAMETELAIKQPRLSRELAKLRDEGVVTTRRSSKVVFYQLSRNPDVRRMVDAVCAALLEERPAKPDVLSALKNRKRLGSYGVFAQTLAR
ncbi:MAG: metalloregulator ArsR/SmtB family transcription factor [Pseudomonadota bacterium]